MKRHLIEFIGREGPAIWLARPESVPANAWPDLRRLLDEREQALARRFVHARHCQEYEAAHALMRLMLSASCGGGVPPAKWSFMAGTHGKPFVSGVGLDFSVSHCEGMVACAVSRHGAVGVDVEFVRRGAPSEIDDWFTESERAWLHGLLQAHRSLGFFRLWCLKEAFVKATGQGLSRSMQNFAVDVERSTVAFATAASDDPARWRLRDCVVEPDHVMALAWTRGDSGEASTTLLAPTDWITLLSTS